MPLSLLPMLMLLPYLLGEVKGPFEIDRLIADRGAYTLWNVWKLAPYRTLFLQVPDLITERVWVDTLITHAL